MKKCLFFCLLIVFLVACGSSKSSSSSSGRGGDEGSSQVCTTGEYKCKTERDGTVVSRYCVDGSRWEKTTCDNGCDEDTGQCSNGCKTFYDCINSCYNDAHASEYCYEDCQSIASHEDLVNYQNFIYCQEDWEDYRDDGGTQMLKDYCATEMKKCGLISGGDSNEEEEEDSPSSCPQGSYRCSGNMLQKCSQGEWLNYEQCSSNEYCSAEEGSCEPYGDDDEPSGYGTYACYEIYDCQVNQCSSSDTDCQKECFYEGTSTAQSEASSMFTCWNSYCSNETDVSCIDDYCYDETMDCGLVTNTSCMGIYSCISECSDSDCAQTCYNNGSSEGKNRYATMVDCWNSYCSDVDSEEFSDCVSDYCYSSTYKCGFRDF